VAEGGGLLNRYTVKSRIEGSNPSVSAILLRATHFAGNAMRAKKELKFRIRMRRGPALGSHPIEGAISGLASPLPPRETCRARP
jgi:hypothetical protein